MTETGYEPRAKSKTYVDRQVVVPRQKHLPDSVVELFELRIGIDGHPVRRALAGVDRDVGVVQQLPRAVHDEPIA